MKILFLHGAIKNSGDFLIAHRSQLLIQSIVQNCEIISMWEGEDFSQKENFEILECCDGIVYGGGPFFTNNIYPHDIPLIGDLDSIKKPMINIGGGWFGRDNKFSTIQNYPMNDKSIQLLKMIEASAMQLSCRDWYTVHMLREKGFRATMTGCPAWYDLNYIDNIDFLLPEEINTICISDPAVSKHMGLAIELIKWVKKRYPSAVIVLVYHRGYDPKAELYKYAQNNDCIIKDISGGYEGFEIYDKCQLHVGFRVHAHIYNLSHRHFSILIEEDGRGAGVNNALGLGSIKAYCDFRVNNPMLKKVEFRLAYKINNEFISELDAFILKTYKTNGLEYKQAFERMQFFYKEMKKHIENISQW